jgi:hypothetical protein
MLHTLTSAVVLGAASLLASSAHAVVLYDGALGTSPTAQSLSYGAFPGGTYHTTAAGSTTLDTTSSSGISAGFTSSTPVVLDRAVGFTYRVDARVLSSTFTSGSRAGFSLIALSSDRRGIELGFHGDEVFAQDDSPLFVRDESAAFDTTAAVRRYELTVLGETYTLRADGATVLSGPVRDYSAFTPIAGFPDPYETPNFLFLGDNSTSAAGSTQFSYVSVLVPEPTTTAALGLAAALVLRRR